MVRRPAARRWPSSADGVPLYQLPDDRRDQAVQLAAPCCAALWRASLLLWLVQGVTGLVMMGGGFGAPGLGAMVGGLGTCLLLLALLNAAGLGVMLASGRLLPPAEAGER